MSNVLIDEFLRDSAVRIKSRREEALKRCIRELEAERDELINDMIEIGQRADLIASAVHPIGRYIPIQAQEEIHGQAGMIAAIAKVRANG